MTTSNDVSLVKREAGAPTIDGDDFIMPNYCLFHNYNSVKKAMGHIIQRTYERPNEWYFLTFKPFNKNYERDLDWYTTKGLDHCRKRVGKVKAYIMTREIKATKVHINMIVVTDRPLSDELHEKQTNRYFIYCQKCINRFDTFEYIIKESKSRYFNKYVDYVFHG